MSSTFDTMQQALYLLDEKIGDSDGQASDILYFLHRLTDKFHDYSHAHNDLLNHGTVVGNLPDLLRIALRYSDDVERKEWLGRRAAV